jgi:hypothetical protein
MRMMVLQDLATNNDDDNDDDDYDDGEDYRTYGYSNVHNTTDQAGKENIVQLESIVNGNQQHHRVSSSSSMDAARTISTMSTYSGKLKDKGKRQQRSILGVVREATTGLDDDDSNITGDVGGSDGVTPRRSSDTTNIITTTPPPPPRITCNDSVDEFDEYEFDAVIAVIDTEKVEYDFDKQINKMVVISSMSNLVNVGDILVSIGDENVDDIVLTSSYDQFKIIYEKHKEERPITTIRLRRRRKKKKTRSSSSVVQDNNNNPPQAAGAGMGTVVVVIVAAGFALCYFLLMALLLSLSSLMCWLSPATAATADADDDVLLGGSDDVTDTLLSASETACTVPSTTYTGRMDYFPQSNESLNELRAKNNLNSSSSTTSTSTNRPILNNHNTAFIPSPRTFPRTCNDSVVVVGGSSSSSSRSGGGSFEYSKIPARSPSIRDNNSPPIDTLSASGTGNGNNNKSAVVSRKRTRTPDDDDSLAGSCDVFDTLLASGTGNDNNNTSAVVFRKRTRTPDDDDFPLGGDDVLLAGSDDVFDTLLASGTGDCYNNSSTKDNVPLAGSEVSACGTGTGDSNNNATTACTVPSTTHTGRIDDVPESAASVNQVQAITNHPIRPFAPPLPQQKWYDVDQFVVALVENYACKRLDGTDSFNWHAFSLEVGMCYNAVPSNVSFLNGLFSTAVSNTLLFNNAETLTNESFDSSGNNDVDISDSVGEGRSIHCTKDISTVSRSNTNTSASSESNDDGGGKMSVEEKRICDAAAAAAAAFYDNNNASSSLDEDHHLADADTSLQGEVNGGGDGGDGGDGGTKKTIRLSDESGLPLLQEFVYDDTSDVAAFDGIADESLPRLAIANESMVNVDGKSSRAATAASAYALAPFVATKEQRLHTSIVVLKGKETFPLPTRNKIDGLVLRFLQVIENDPVMRIVIVDNGIGNGAPAATTKDRLDKSILVIERRNNFRLGSRNKIDCLVTEFLHDLEDDTHEMLCDTRTDADDYHGLDGDRDTEKEVEAIVRIFPEILIRRQQILWTYDDEEVVEAREGLYPIQCMGYCHFKAVSFIRILAELAIELGLFEEQERGGLLCQANNGENLLHYLMLTDDKNKRHEAFDDKCLQVLIQLRQMGLLTKEDIQMYSMLKRLINPSVFVAKRFRFLVEWDPTSLPQTMEDGFFSFDYASMDAPTIEGFRMVFEYLIRYYPSKKGINLIFQKDNYGLTPFLQASYLCGYENDKMPETTDDESNRPTLNLYRPCYDPNLYRAYYDYGHEKVTDVVEDILQRYSATTPINIKEALIMAATDENIHLGCVYFLLRRSSDILETLLLSSSTTTTTTTTSTTTSALSLPSKTTM